jgi:hypothetical protein
VLVSQMLNSFPFIRVNYSYSGFILVSFVPNHAILETDSGMFGNVGNGLMHDWRKSADSLITPTPPGYFISTVMFEDPQCSCSIFDSPPAVAAHMLCILRDRSR